MNKKFILVLFFCFSFIGIHGDNFLSKRIEDVSSRIDRLEEYEEDKTPYILFTVLYQSLGGLSFEKYEKYRLVREQSSASGENDIELNSIYWTDLITLVDLLMSQDLYMQSGSTRYEYVVVVYYDGKEKKTAALNIYPGIPPLDEERRPEFSDERRRLMFQVYLMNSILSYVNWVTGNEEDNLALEMFDRIDANIDFLRRGESVPRGISEN